MMIEVQPTERFSDRADYYARYRPGYPDAVVEAIARETGVTPGAHVADAGSGTGISAALFLRHGYRVTGVEPNAAMRAQAEALLADFPEFRSVAGTAEATGLPAGSVDLVLAATAFHWFDAAAARTEFQRILRPGGWIALLWNRRRDDGDFMAAYEALLHQHVADYPAQWGGHRQKSRRAAAAFLAGGRTLRFDNAQQLDRESFRGRALSSSYAPLPAAAGFAPFAAALDELFEKHATDGQVRFTYDTELYLGQLGPE